MMAVTAPPDIVAIAVAVIDGWIVAEETIIVGAAVQKTPVPD